MIELCFFSLDQWGIKIHLLWGKCLNIPHWSRSLSTNERWQHVEYFSKSKTRVGRHSLVKLTYSGGNCWCPCLFFLTMISSSLLKSSWTWELHSLEIKLCPDNKVRDAYQTWGWSLPGLAYNSQLITHVYVTLADECPVKSCCQKLGKAAK